MQIDLNINPMKKSQQLAAETRKFLKQNNVFCVNIMSSPGSGKTALLCKLIPMLGDNIKTSVIVGDAATDNDARRMIDAGINAHPLCTGMTGCHISPASAKEAIEKLDCKNLDLIIIENVGNLLCPAGSDLGEDEKIAMISVTEGEDKPLKYPLLFKSCGTVIINKIDIAEYVECDIELLKENIRKINGNAEIFELSAKTGQGLEKAARWLENHLANNR